MACLLQLARDSRDPVFDIQDPFDSLFEQSRFDDYEIESEIARGGMGVVFRARQMSLNRPVALKMILAGQLATPELIRRFRTEAEAAAKLAHANIVPIYEVGESETLHFFSMKLIEGENLAKLLGEYTVQDGTASQVMDRQRCIATLMKTVADALAFAHEHGVLHRDIKPSNILVDERGEPHLTDFGLAKLTEQPQDALTRTTAVLGSPSYMSPEQASGRHDQMTTHADIYSFGAVLYELLTGRPPFSGKNAIETIRRVTDQPPQRPRTLNDRVHPDLETIALRCLEKEPQRRYASAADVGAELDRFLRGESIVARPIGPLQELWRWGKRNPRVSLLASTLLLALICGTIGVAWQSHRASKANEALSETVNNLTWSRITGLVKNGQLRAAITHLARMMRVDPTDWRVAMYAMSVLDQARCHVPVGPGIRHPGQATINTAQLDPTGRILATGSEDKTIRFWNAKDSRQIGDPLVFNDAVKQLAFDHAGKHIAVVSGDRKRLQIFDVQLRREIRAVRFDKAIKGLDFSSPRSEIVLAAGTRLHAIHVEQEDLDDVYDFARAIESVSLSSDAKRAVLRLGNRESIAVNMDSGKELLRVNDFRCGDAAISKDGRLMAACENNFGRVAVWHIDHGEKQCEMRTEEGDIRNLTFAADGNRLLGSSVFHEWVISYDTSTGLQSGSRMNHKEQATSIQSFDGGRQLMMVSRRNGVRCWDAATSSLSSEPIDIPNGVIDAGTTESGGLIWTGSCTELGGRHIDSIQLWRLHEPHTPPVLSESKVPYLGSAASVSPSGRWVASNVVEQTENGRDDFVSFIDVQSGQEVAERLKTDSDPYGIVFTPDEDRLVVTTVRGKLYLLSVPDFELLHGPVDSGHPIQPSRMSPNGDCLATGSANGWVTLWDLGSMTPIWKTRHSKSRLNDLCFSTSGRLLGSCANDKSAKVWHAKNGELALDLEGHSDRVYNIRIDEKKKLVATASEDRNEILWRLSDGSKVAVIEHSSGPNYVDIHPTKNLIVTGDRGGNCLLWDSTSGEQVGRVMEHDQPVQCTKFSSDGKRILAADQSGFRLWDTETQQPLTALLSHTTQASLGVDSDGCRPEFTQNDDAVFMGPVSYRSLIWQLPRPSGDIPSWFPEFLESIVMQRLEQGSEVPILVESHQREQLVEQMSEFSDSDYLRWSRRWLQSVRQTEP